MPVPYDFDFSGLVDAPYATPPTSVAVSNVRQRRYRGFCRHNAAGARAVRRVPRQGARGDRQAVAAVPSLDAARATARSAYLDGFFRDIATDQSAEAKLLKTCLG